MKFCVGSLLASKFLLFEAGAFTWPHGRACNSEKEDTGLLGGKVKSTGHHGKLSDESVVTWTLAAIIGGF